MISKSRLKITRPNLSGGQTTLSNKQFDALLQRTNAPAVSAGQPTTYKGGNNGPFMSLEESRAEGMRFLEAHLSPATARIDKIRVPDGYPAQTVAMSKVFFSRITPDANGNAVIVMLPFLECPFAQYDTQTLALRGIPDPVMSTSDLTTDFMRVNRIYGFRPTLQSMTIYNDTAFVENSGSVTGALFPSQVDTHTVRQSSGECRYVRVIDNLPLSLDDVASAVRTPYTAPAREGVYMVNRNFTADWSMRMRDRDWEKATYTNYSRTSGNPIAGTVVRNPLAYRKADGTFTCASLVNAAGSMNDVIANDTTIGVTNAQGTGFGLGVAWFHNLPAGASLRLKMVHGYEFILKPGSQYIPLMDYPPFRESWVFKAITVQLRDKMLVMPADANFIGALLSGLKTILPYVLPLAKDLLPKAAGAFSSWLTGKVTSDNVQLSGERLERYLEQQARQRLQAAALR